MFATITKFVKDILTENDNQTFCIARVSLMIALTTFIVMAGYHLYMTHIIVLTEYSTGIMQILGGGGAIIGAKNITGSK